MPILLHLPPFPRIPLSLSPSRSFSLPFIPLEVIPLYTARGPEAPPGAPPEIEFGTF